VKNAICPLTVNLSSFSELVTFSVIY